MAAEVNFVPTKQSAPILSRNLTNVNRRSENAETYFRKKILYYTFSIIIY